MKLKNLAFAVILVIREIRYSPRYESLTIREHSNNNKWLIFLTTRLRVVTVAPAAFLAVTCLASVGVTLAFAFLAFNLHFRKHK